MKKLARQHAGGLANFHGNTFEHCFGVWRVVLALYQLAGGKPSRLALQLKDAHVDDWVEESGGKRRHFQLKRKTRVSWREVAEDFKAQLRTADEVTLVVASSAQRKSLARSPARVAKAGVMVFPRHHKPERLLKTSLVRQAVVAACVKSKPTSADLDFLWAVIDFAWQNVRQPGLFKPVREIWEHLPDRTHLLRQTWTPTARWLKAAKVLSAIAGFTFSLDGGHLFYDDGAGTRGILSCRTSDFDEFVRSVLKTRPQSLDDVRELL
jgi:hypothetical protein